LTNPGKRFFLQLTADSVEDVNRKVDGDNINYARKTMIRCGLALGLDGACSVGQLFSHLQETIAKHLQYFPRARTAQFQYGSLKVLFEILLFFPSILGLQLGLLCCIFFIAIFSNLYIHYEFF